MITLQTLDSLTYTVFAIKICVASNSFLLDRPTLTIALGKPAVVREFAMIWLTTTSAGAMLALQVETARYDGSHFLWPFWKRFHALPDVHYS